MEDLQERVSKLEKKMESRMGWWAFTRFVFVIVLFTLLFT